MFILERKIQVLRLVIPIIFPNRPLAAFRLSHGPPCAFIVKPVTENPVELCCSVASAGPHSENPYCKDLGPCQVATLPCAVFSLLSVLQNFFPLLLLVLYEQI